MLGENPDETDDPEVRAHPERGARREAALAEARDRVRRPGDEPDAAGRDLRDHALHRHAAPGARDRRRRGGLAGRARGPRRPATACSRSRTSRSRWWGDFEELVRKHPGDALELRYQRGGEPREARFEITSRAALDEFGKVRDMGWVGLGHRRLTAMVGVPERGGARAPRGAALRRRDRLAGRPAGRGLVGASPPPTRRPRAPLRAEIERGPENRASALVLELPALGSSRSARRGARQRARLERRAGLAGGARGARSAAT